MRGTIPPLPQIYVLPFVSCNATFHTDQIQMFLVTHPFLIRVVVKGPSLTVPPARCTATFRMCLIPYSGLPIYNRPYILSHFAKHLLMIQRNRSAHPSTSCFLHGLGKLVSGFPAGGGIFPPRHRVQTGSETHTASYPEGGGSSFP
jgi:hypothetical protein